MAVIAPIVADFDGQEIVWTAASAGGDEVQFDARRVILFRNDSGGSITVTISIEATVMGKVVPDQTVAVPAGDYFTVRMGTQNVEASTGTVGLTYSGVTTFSVAVIHVPA